MFQETVPPIRTFCHRIRLLLVLYWIETFFVSELPLDSFWLMLPESDRAASHRP
jgi:hypothetical protein